MCALKLDKGGASERLRRYALPGALALGGLLAAGAHEAGRPSHRAQAEIASSQWGPEGRRRLEERRSAQLAHLRAMQTTYAGDADIPPPDDFADPRTRAEASQAEAEARERSLNAPITDPRTIRLTGETEAQNMLNDGEIEAYFGRPRAFADDVREHLREQLRAEVRNTEEVVDAQRAFNDVLSEEAGRLADEGRIGRALELYRLAGNGLAIADQAMRHRRPDLAIGIWRTDDSYSLRSVNARERLIDRILYYGDEESDESFLRQLTAQERQAARDYVLREAYDMERQIQERQEAMRPQSQEVVGARSSIGIDQFRGMVAYFQRLRRMIQVLSRLDGR